MSSEEPTRAQAQHLRLLAELGGSATFNEMQDHPDFTSPSHFTNLRKQGLVTLNRSPANPDTKVWVLSDEGREVVRDLAADWVSARESIEATADSEEVEA